MGDAADDALDQALRYEFFCDENDDWDDDFGWADPAWFRATPVGLTRNQLTAFRIKSGGATRAAHEVGAVLQHLLALPR